ncbi:hypothetical protein [Bradyrhizobium manausense]|nr:hypothetical protein [Bradyrhizobium manausense]
MRLRAFIAVLCVADKRFAGIKEGFDRIRGRTPRRQRLDAARPYR